jgi:hypothetical protein
MNIHYKYANKPILQKIMSFLTSVMSMCKCFNFNFYENTAYKIQRATVRGWIDRVVQYLRLFWETLIWRKWEEKQIEAELHTGGPIQRKEKVSGELGSKAVGALRGCSWFQNLQVLFRSVFMQSLCFSVVLSLFFFFLFCFVFVFNFSCKSPPGSKSSWYLTCSKLAPSYQRLSILLA